MSNYEPNPNRESQQEYLGIDRGQIERMSALQQSLTNAQNCASIGPATDWYNTNYGCGQREQTKAEKAENDMRQRREMALQVIARFGDDADKAKATAFLARVAADILQRNDGP